MANTSDPADLSEDELEHAERLRQSLGEFVRAVRSIEGSSGAAQSEILGLLARDGEQSIASLARRRGVRHQSASAMVAELESDGLVCRTTDPDDRRGVLIILTDAGHAAVARERRSRAGFIAVAARALNELQRETLNSVPAILETLSETIATIGQGHSRRGAVRGRQEC